MKTIDLVDRLLLITWMVLAMGAVTYISAEAASIADTPLPLLDGTDKPIHVYSVTGVTDTDSLATFFHCTSTEKTGGATIKVGVEVFGSSGGLQNDVTTPGTNNGVLNIAPGQARTIGTRGSPAFVDDEDLAGPIVEQGSARILATSTKIICAAMIVDRLNNPPTSMVSLPVIKKLKQKGD